MTENMVATSLWIGAVEGFALLRLAGHLSDRGHESLARSAPLAVRPPHQLTAG